MSMFGILDISAAGLDVQKTRLEVAASNLANANTTRTADGGLYQPMNVVVGSEATHLANGAARRPSVLELVPSGTEPRLVYEPGHPDADEHGYVKMPGVDSLSTMLDLMSISRSYEANLRVFDITRTLLQKTLDVGSRR